MSGVERFNSGRVLPATLPFPEGTANGALVFLSGFAMGLTPGKSGELTKSYWLREIAGPERAPLANIGTLKVRSRSHHPVG